MYLENSLLSENAHSAVLRSGTSLFLPKYTVSSKLRFHNSYDTVLPESKSILLPILSLHNYNPAEMSINNWLIKFFHYFSSRTIPWYSSYYIPYGLSAFI